MLGVKLQGKGVVKLDTFPQPKASGKEILVKVEGAGICGSDLTPYLGEGQDAIPGHEVVGTVEEVQKPSFFKPGDRVLLNCHVTCGHCVHCRNGDWIFCPELQNIGSDKDGGCAEYILIPEKCCFDLPNEVPFEVGVLITDALGTPYHAIKKLHILPGQRVGIFGAGSLGLCGLLVAKKFGAKVFVFEINEYRLKLAKRLGAFEAINSREVDIGQRFDSSADKLDCTIDCAGQPETVRYSLDLVRKGGKVALVGTSHKVELDIYRQIGKRELQIFGSQNYNVREYHELVYFVKNTSEVANVVTHTYPLEYADKAFEQFAQRNTGKVILHPSERGSS